MRYGNPAELRTPGCVRRIVATRIIRGMSTRRATSTTTRRTRIGLPWIVPPNAVKDRAIGVCAACGRRKEPDLPAGRLNNATMMRATRESAGLAIYIGENMKREKQSYEEKAVIGFDALYDSMCKCRKGVLWKDSVAAFYLRGIEKCTALAKQLQSGDYKAAPVKRFQITSPKPRDIASVAFRDRVYQRSLNDNVVYPIMSQGFVYDNYACQKGKGTDAARDRMKQFLRRHYRKYGLDGYVAQFDIHGYYPNMSHEIAEATFKRRLPHEAFAQVQKILREQYAGEKGYNPGSQLVQIAGIAVLDGLDHFIKEQLHIKLYIRYMDDFILIHPDREYLYKCENEIIRYLHQLKFEINPDKTKVFPIRKGIPFLGFHFFLTESGKVLMRIKSKNVKAERRKLSRLVRKSLHGDLPRGKVDESYAAWRNHASKGDNWKMVQRMDRYYKNLWKNYQ